MKSDPAGSEPIALDSEIERRRKEWDRGRRTEHLKFVKQFCFHIAPTFMDYLHGDVDEMEEEFGCRYEYARESKMMWEAAQEREGLMRANPQADIKQVAMYIVRHRSYDLPMAPFWMTKLLACASFPTKDWKELSATERHAIMDGPPREKMTPLPMPDVWSLTGMLRAPPYKHRLRKLLEESKSVIESVPPGKKGKPINLVWPIMQMWESHYWAVFAIDFSKGETLLSKEFTEWLRQKENRERLEKYEKPRTGTTGKPLDRLRDLAAWRLYREFENDWNKANDFAAKHRKRFTSAEIREKYKTKERRKKFQPGSPKPFRDAKPKKENQATGKLVLIPANEADLFGNPADAREAQARAWKYLAEIAPKEFAPPGTPMLASFGRLEKFSLNS